MDSGLPSTPERPELILSGFRVGLGIPVTNVRVLNISAGVLHLKPPSMRINYT